ncbi:hypothetical protein PF005_g13871 [Phytophthora fragariae]|uniref:Uncharacterized protein n=1 Tax=Phytophthora fragariae TaxID=53985 RepID=A0A6A3XVX1_9STRA|nr:hypothetical protein PF005_g13871 [Phytophthora fragariae]
MDPKRHGDAHLTVHTDHEELDQETPDPQTQYAKLETPVKVQTKELNRQDTFNSDAGESGGQESLASASDAADYVARQRPTIVSTYRPSGRTPDGSTVRFSGADRMAHDIQLGPRLDDPLGVEHKVEQVEQSRKDTDESSKADATEHTMQMSSIELRDSVLPALPSRFREHLKMQLGAFKESDQTGDVKAHMLRSKMKRKKRQQQKNETTPPTPSKAAVTKDVRKRLFRGVQLGDLKLIRRSIRIAKLHLGENFARDLYPDPVMVFGIFGLAKKNPMHVAAYQGNIAAMDLLYKANFRVNAFDKVSRFEIKRAAGTRDVMISYTHSHMEFALKLRKSLEDANITVWLDLMDPSGIGEDYAHSEWCLKELALAKQVGTPIMAISTEQAKISEELQVYLYTRQLVPFESAIVKVEQVSEKETRYEYDEAAYKNQLRMLLDGMRDEIEKRKVDNIKRNMRRAETNPMTGSGHASGGMRSRRLNHAASGMSSTNTYGMDSMKFDERALALSAFDTPNYYQYDSGGSSIHEIGDDSAMPVVIGNTRRRGPPGSSRSIGSNSVFSTSQRQMRLNYDYNATNLSILSSTSSSNSFVDDGGVSDSIVLDTGGYYFHKATKPKRGGRKDVISERDSNEVEEPGTSDSIVEDLQELTSATASGEQFVFISHGDYHQRFVRKLCVEMCREGGLRCYVDRKHMVKLASAIDEDTEEEADRSGRPVLSRDDDMSVRIHEAKEAILKCSAFVLLISEKTLASELVKDQLAFAEDKGKKILPVVVNRMDFGLDIKYSLARSEFFHFFTKGDMVGFRQSLRHLLDALREEVYGISIGGPLAGQLSSFSPPPSFNGAHGTGSDVQLRGGFADLRDSFVSTGSYNPSLQVESSMRRRRPQQSQGVTFASARSDVSNFGLPPTRLSQTFADTSGTTRSITSDMSLSHSMIGNFSTLVGRVDDFDEDDELCYAGIQDDDLDSDEEVEVEVESGQMRVVQEAPSFSRALQRHPALGALSSDGSFDTRQRGSNSSISMLELAESSENISFDALLGDKTPTK